MQELLIRLWSIWAGVHALVEWHASQVFGAGMWFAGLPGAVLPLWQVIQVLLTRLWSILAGDHALVEWHASQVFGTGMWFAGLPATEVPL
jgi:hypothetical protein